MIRKNIKNYFYFIKSNKNLKNVIIQKNVVKRHLTKRNALEWRLKKLKKKNFNRLF